MRGSAQKLLACVPVTGALDGTIVYAAMDAGSAEL